MMGKIKRGERRYIYRHPGMRLAAGCLDLMGSLGVRLLTWGRGWKIPEDAISRPERILAIRMDHIGDVIFMRPSLRALRQRYPQAHLTVLVSSAAAALLKQEPGVDTILAWDAPWFDRSGARRKQPGFAALGRLLRKQRFDLGLDFRGDVRHLVLLYLARVRCRVGYGITGGGFLLHQCLRLRPAAHEVERDLDLIRSLGQGMHLPQAYAPLALSAEELSQGLAFWQTRKPHVVIHPGAGDPVKCWPPEHFSRLCRALGAACEILVVGSAGEQGLAEQVVQGSGPGVRNVAGQTPLRMLASMIAGADLFIGNDSGPGHIAVTQGIPVVMLWSETNEPDEWGPWGAGVQASVIRNPSRPEALEEALTAGRAYLAQKGRQS